MSNLNPFISVVIPVYNRADIINRTIDSVLNQSYTQFEIIIVDDGSKDNVLASLSLYNDSRINYIKHPTNLGATVARNTGIKAAKGEWIAFLDSDDIWISSKLEEQVKEIPHITDEYAVIHCGLQYVDFHSGKFLTQRTSRGNINEIVRYNIGIIPQTSTWLIRKEVLLNVGPFDENMPAHQESELGLRIAQLYKFWLIDKILVYVTMNHNQIRSNKESYILAKKLILEKHSKLLSNDLIYNFNNIIAGYYLVRKDFNHAKKYLKAALIHKLKFKSVLTYSLLNLFPRLTNNLYLNSYKKRGLL